MTNFGYKIKENILTPNNKPAGYIGHENCDNFNKRNLAYLTFYYFNQF